MSTARSERSPIAVGTILLVTFLLVLGLHGTSSALVPCGLDPAFGASGVLASDLGGDDLANGLAIRPGGSVVVAGSSFDQMMAAQYAPDGGLDPGFGTGGIVRISRDPTLSSTASDVALQQDGKVVLAGRELGAVSRSSLFDIAVARLNPDGTRDASFGGGDGVVYLDLQRQQNEATAVALDSAGRIVVAGRSWVVGGNSDAVVVRLLPDGSLDSSFGKQGVVVLDLRSNFDIANGLAVQADGALVVAGSYRPSVLTPWLARLRPDGTRDRRFGRMGLVTPSISGAWYDVAVQRDGRIVTAGEVALFTIATGGQAFDLTVARYLQDGTADTGFGGVGMATVRVDPSGVLHGQATGVAVHADGTILAVGAATATNVSDMVAAALLADGTPDARFGSGGVVLHHDLGGANSALQDVALRSDGLALAAGYVGANSALARFTPCG
jgi:uncharacterized delta-60 repeat protein